MSSNNLTGTLPGLLEGPITLPIFRSDLRDLSNNRFSGPMPSNFDGSVSFLSISNNQIDGEIPASICKRFAQVIDLSNNSLTGSIPSCKGESSMLQVLDLSKNNLPANIPGSLGQLSMLQTLHQDDNEFSGELPSSFQNLSSLETLDLGNNRLMGRIPPWIGAGFQSLRILILRSNAFFGELPSALSNLSSLQVLDLAENQLNGSIPACFGDFKAMSEVQTNNIYLFYGALNLQSVSMIISKYYEENVVLTMKGQSRIFNKILNLVVCLDLSGNNLTGDLPGEITKLLGLVFLNLSRNHISGHIPKRISELKQLSSLDLSSNKFTGAIPRSMASLSSLGYMNLSNKNFSGRIPYKDHLTTFEASSFAGNPGLCGDPLTLKCPGDDPDKYTTSGESGDSFVDKWFYFEYWIGICGWNSDNCNEKILECFLL
ncbi:receptor-like protein EIX2 [Ziziphus jujuba]|uniref:Receptor-like protein EIX2 n=1 Tax=Ziziphus jujuba TaxID=326968 RepID=A0ABM4A168_ZIZJJ|nr:receptor-like protein EIX2 [Ziziphus jujuba]